MGERAEFRGFSEGLATQDLTDQVGDFLSRNILQPLALFVERLGHADGNILHVLMRLGRPANQEEIFPARDALVAVPIVEADPQQANDFGLLFPGLARHGRSFRDD